MIHTLNIDTLFESESIKSLLDEMNLRWQEEQRKRHQFTADLTGEEKAEFINGEIMLQSPAKARHILVTEHLITLTKIYLLYHPIGRTFTEKALVRMTRNDYEPDFIFYGNDKAESILPETELFPPPDFIVEVLSPSTEKKDRGVKFRDYARHQVREYWIIDPQQEHIEQYLLSENNEYQLSGILIEDEITCQTITGLVFPVRAVFEERILKQWVSNFLIKSDGVC